MSLNSTTHQMDPPTPAPLTARDLVVTRRYNWKNQSERLVYLGMCDPRNGRFYQFAKLEAPDEVWCEVRQDELHLLEPSAHKLPVILPTDTDAEAANAKYGDQYGVDWVYAKPAPVAQPKAGGSYASLLQVVQAYGDAFEDLFGQCASNPIRNAWGQKVDMTKLNEARRTASMARAAPFVHKKTGGKYQFVGNARIQTSVSLDDMCFVVVYRGEDGKLWVRPDKEFVERFVQEGRPNRLVCDDFLEAESEAGGVLAVSPELYERMRPKTDIVYPIQVTPYIFKYAEELFVGFDPTDGGSSVLGAWRTYDEANDAINASVAQTLRPPVDDMQSKFNAAIDFAILQGSSAAEFLESWREGDTSEWPEFSNSAGDAK